jgi:hypothetical protein
MYSFIERYREFWDNTVTPLRIVLMSACMLSFLQLGRRSITMADEKTEGIVARPFTCVHTLGASALPHTHVASCASCSTLGPVHLHPPSSAAHSTGARGHTSSCALSDPLYMLLEQWRHLAGKAAMVCSVLSARIDVLGRPWRHTGHFGPRTARTRDAHDVPSPSPASEHNRCPLVHCSMRPRGASVSRVCVRSRRALLHVVSPWRGERGGVPTTVRPTRTPAACKLVLVKSSIALKSLHPNGTLIGSTRS